LISHKCVIFITVRLEKYVKIKLIVNASVNVGVTLRLGLGLTQGGLGF